MTELVSDTHSLIWHLVASPKLGANAQKAFESADKGTSRIWVPTICLVEIVYLSERGRIPHDMLVQATSLLQNSGGSYMLAPLDEGVVQSMAAIPRNSVPEMPDRIIAGTAFSLNLPLITADRAITASGSVPITW